MNKEKEIENVSIEIKQATFTTLRLLPNKVWNILAEYVDNSISSKRIQEKEIIKLEGSKYKFIVKIDISETEIRVWDNAGGIDSLNFERSLELANLPANKSELNEFGMGMKTSSIWLGDVWTLRSASINESVERLVEFDLNKVVSKELKSLKVKTNNKKGNEHFTEIIIKELSENAPSSYQLNKIQDHLSSIYRIPIRKGEMELYLNGNLLTYEDPKILFAPYVRANSNKEILWKQEIDFPLGKRYRVSGYIGILDKMSNSISGLSLFKKGRVIQGSHDEKYRPDVLFGKDPGSALYKGLFGELDLNGFDVTYNKGSFRDVDALEKVMVEIKKILTQNKNNFIIQASEFSRLKSKENIEKAAKKLVANIEKSRKKEPLKVKIETFLDSNKDKAKTKENNDQLKKAKSINPGLDTDVIDFSGKKIKLKMFFVNEKDLPGLFTVYDEGNIKGINEIHYKINLAHPFFEKHESILKAKYDPIVDLLEAFVIAEISTSSVVNFGDKIRDAFNNYLEISILN